MSSSWLFLIMCACDLMTGIYCITCPMYSILPIFHFLQESWLAGISATALFTLLHSTLRALSLSRRQWFGGSLISRHCLSSPNMKFHSLFTSKIKYTDINGIAQVDRNTISLEISQQNPLNKMWGMEQRGRERNRQNGKRKRGRMA